MRRNWISVLLFALALAIQALAPTAANVAIAQGSAETRQSLALCSQIGDVPADDFGRLPGHGNHHSGACLLCQICCDGVAPFEARPSQVCRVPVQWTALAWMAMHSAMPAPRVEHSRQARAPPAFS
jgi:hypothetical protein